MGFFVFPLSRISIYFIVGILCARLFLVDVILWPILICAGFLIVAVFVSKQFFEFVLIGAGITLGMLTTAVHETKPASHYSRRDISSGDFQVTLREKLKPTEKMSRFIAIVDSVGNTPSTGKILLNVRGRQDFAIGTRMLIKSKIDTSFTPPNPGSFDYGKYLKNKSVFAQTFVDDENYMVIGLQKDIYHLADRLRSRILGNLKKSGVPSRELSVAAALILGQQQDIDRAILEDYQYAGAVHILSVSGLHVGFIVVFLNFAMARLPKSGRWRLARLLITVVSLWGFALIAGMSPSVIRSAVMFSFVAFGFFLRRSTNVFHTLTASALVILIADPSLLFDIGFQLSYSALYFILALQPLSARVNIKNPVLRYFADIAVVSLAAQIGTAPLTLYYFHQFPGLFLVTNIVIIPFLSIIMAAGIAVMLWAVIAAPPQMLAEILSWMIRFLNSAIAQISSFRSLVATDIPFTMPMTITAMMIALSLTTLVRKQNYKTITLSMICLAMFQIVILHELRQSSTSAEFIIFNQRRQSLVIKRNADQVVVTCDRLSDDRNLKSYLVNSFASAKFKRFSNVEFWQSKKILIIDSSLTSIPAVAADIVLLRQSPKVNLDRIMEVSAPKTVIADGSNFRSYVARWKATCTKQKIPFHYTGEKGFFRVGN